MTKKCTRRDNQIQESCLNKLIQNRKLKLISIAILLSGIIFGIPIVLIVKIHKPIDISTTVVIGMTTPTKSTNSFLS